MKDGLYVVYDKVAMEAAPPFPAKNDGVAQRMYEFAVNSPERRVVDKNDFRLYKIGHWDTEKMLLEPLQTPQEVFCTPKEYDDAGKAEEVY